MDLFGHYYRAEVGLVCGEFGLLGGAEDAGFQQALVGTSGLVIGSGTPPERVGGVSDGFLGGGEVVRPITAQYPELVE